MQYKRFLLRNCIPSYFSQLYKGLIRRRFMEWLFIVKFYTPIRSNLFNFCIT